MLHHRGRSGCCSPILPCKTWGARIEAAASRRQPVVPHRRGGAGRGRALRRRHRLHDPRGHRQVELQQSDARARGLRRGGAQVAAAQMAADPSCRRRAADLSRAAGAWREGHDGVGCDGGDGVAQRAGRADRHQPALSAAGRCPAPPCLGAAARRALAARSQGPVRGHRRHGADRAQHRGAAEDAGHALDRRPPQRRAGAGLRARHRL